MEKTHFYLFMDESGNHGLTDINQNQKVFLLCGVLMYSEMYAQLDQRFKNVKQSFWPNKKVIFHSRDIRKCNNEFNILFDLEIKANFYNQLNNAISDSKFTVFTSAIKKDECILKHGRLFTGVYELCLSFVIERAIFFLDKVPDFNKVLYIVMEKRGKKEDKKLEEHFQKLLAKGTGYVSASRLKEYRLAIHFREKNKNINGLQLADLVAYPCASKISNPERANPAYDLVCEKYYMNNGKLYGNKVYP